MGLAHIAGICLGSDHRLVGPRPALVEMTRLSGTLSQDSNPACFTTVGRDPRRFVHGEPADSRSGRRLGGNGTRPEPNDPPLARVAETELTGSTRCATSETLVWAKSVRLPMRGRGDSMHGGLCGGVRPDGRRQEQRSRCAAIMCISLRASFDRETVML